MWTCLGMFPPEGVSPLGRQRSLSGLAESPVSQNSSTAPSPERNVKSSFFLSRPALRQDSDLWVYHRKEFQAGAGHGGTQTLLISKARVSWRVRLFHPASAPACSPPYIAVLSHVSFKYLARTASAIARGGNESSYNYRLR